MADRGCGTVEEVLAVVDDEQQLLRPEVARHDILDGRTLAGTKPPGVTDLRHDEVRVGDRCQLHQPRTVGEVVYRSPGGLDGEPGLARAAHSGEHGEPVGCDQRRELGELLRAPDERGEGIGQVVAAQIGGSGCVACRGGKFGGELLECGPHRRILRHRGGHGGRQLWRQLGAHDVHVGEGAGETPHQRLLHRRRLPRVVPGEHLVHDDAEAVDVRFLSDRSARQLLGRHVGRRAGAGHVCVGFGERFERDPEVGQVGAAGPVEQDVRGLDVTMDDPVPVCHGETGGKFLEQRCGGEGIPGALGQRIGQRPAREQTHHQPGPFGIASVLVQGHDVGVLEAGDDPRLIVETGGELLGGCERRVDDLDGDVAVEVVLASPIDDAEPALTEPLAQLEAPPLRLHAMARYRPLRPCTSEQVRA